MAVKAMAMRWTGAMVGLALIAALAGCKPSDVGSQGGPAKVTAQADALPPGSAVLHRSPAPGMTLYTDATHPLPATSDPQDGWPRAQADAVQRLVRELTARGDAESLLDAALLLPLACDGSDDCSAHMKERARLLAAAGRLAGEHPLIAFLQAEACMYTNDCAAAYQRLAAVAPDNLLAHLGQVHVAAQAGDPAALDRTLHAAATASLFDSYIAELTMEVERALQRLPAPSAPVRQQFAQAIGLGDPLGADDARLLQALGISTAAALPPLQGLMQTCGVERIRQWPGRRAPCLAVFARMAASDTTLARSLGLTQLVELTTSTADAALWRERLREFAWVQEHYSARQSQLLVADLRLQVEQGEWVAMRALLQRMGVPLQPPAGWLPANARYRQLLSATG